MKDNWDDCGVHTQALILAYDQVRDHDESEQEAHLVGARMPRGATEPPRG